jgi:hypothetical protein
MPPRVTLIKSDLNHTTRKQGAACGRGLEGGVQTPPVKYASLPTKNRRKAGLHRNTKVNCAPFSVFFLGFFLETRSFYLLQELISVALGKH